MAKLGWGVVGIGRIVTTRVAPAIIQEQHCELVAGVSRDQARAEAFAAEFGATSAYSSYDEMIADPDVEAVFIASPNALHADQVVTAAQGGKHVLCDKPLALTVAEAIRADDACSAAGVELGINFHYRHMPWVQEVRRLVAVGTIGDVLTIHLDGGAGLSPPKDWRLDPALAGLGTTFNHGVHLFDLLRLVLDSDPVEVTAMFDDERVGEAVETEGLYLLRFGNGTLAYVTCNHTNPFPQNDIAIYGTKGRIAGVNLTRSAPGELKVTTDEGEVVTRYAEPAAHRSTVAAYATAVLEGRTPNASGLDGLHSALLCDAIARSVTEQRRVKLDYSAIRSE